MATTAVMTSSAFLSIIRENKLVEEEKLQAALRALSPTALTGENALPVADALVEQKLLTRFQANLLLQGKSRSLRITSKYRLLDRLGAGGMGLVYLCEHIRMKRLVALKVLPNSQSKEPGNLERFYREAQAVAALKHPNIVQAYDVDADNGIHYLVMEYIDGINLEKLVGNHGPLDAARAAHYVAQAADGLQHAAERGLVHRDIKPSNLLIDREGYVKVLDMGLARFFDTRDNITERYDNNAVIGTADFISPEQALNSHEVDTRADIYSLGCTFYYLLTGRAPYHDANVTQKLLLHQLREPTPVEELAPGTDPDLVAVLRKMMAKKPEERYQQPGEVVAALAPWTEEPIAPPTREELPENPMAGPFDKAGGSTVTNNYTSAMPRQAPRPSRGMVTERMTESAIRRMDGIPNDDEEAAGGKKRYLIGGAVLLVAVGGLVLAIAKPWQESKPAPKQGPVVTYIDEPADGPAPPIPGGGPPPKQAVPNPPPNNPPPKFALLGAGLVHVTMDPRTPRPGLQNGGVRATPTDVLIFSGPDLRKNTPDEGPMLQVLRKEQVGGNGGVGTPGAPVVPYAVSFVNDAPAPNTLLTADPAGGLRPLRLTDKEYFVTKTFAGAKPDHNALAALVPGNVALPGGVTTVNALVAEFCDVAAAKVGSTLKVNSGALLLMGTTTERSFVLGAGEGPLTIDFNGRAGYLTVCGEQDFVKIPGGREYVIRARLANFGNHPLVLSGLSGNVVRLDGRQGAYPRLVIQGHQLAVKDKLFRVTFKEDAHLGPPNAPVTLADAALVLSGAPSARIDRPLHLTRTGQLITTAAKGELRWVGKIGGGTFSASGPGSIVLARRDNDYAGGTEVWGGTLVLAADPNGTPAGAGHVNVHGAGTLTGSGLVLKDLTVKGGTLQPGTDDGKSLVCNGAIVFERPKAKDKNGKEFERAPKIRFRLGSADARPLVFAGPPPVNLNGAILEVVLVGDFKPTPQTKCYLVTNRPGVRFTGVFKDAQHMGTVKTADGKWAAKISYLGNADRGTTDGGADVVLFDFAPLP